MHVIDIDLHGRMAKAWAMARATPRARSSAAGSETFGIDKVVGVFVQDGLYASGKGIGHRNFNRYLRDGDEIRQAVSIVAEAYAKADQK
ncbi:hypothetical protein [Consotaella salsifontis]|nr:hypothetical protein [Consotaella salsifontis]